MKRVLVKIPYTCGELFQGSLDGIPCLVSCPIDKYSVAELRFANNLEPISVNLPPKAQLAYTYAMKKWGVRNNFSLMLVSNLPVGRGYGTSTADIGVTIYGIGCISGITDLDPVKATLMAISIEPTDSTYFEKLTLINHLNGALFEEIDFAPKNLNILVLDPGGEIDSISFNNRSWGEVLHPLAYEHRIAFNLLKQGIIENNLPLIGEATSLSAKLFQKVLYNPLIDYCFAHIRTTKILGICRAHSGTIVGILYDERNMTQEEVLYYIKGIRDKLENVFNVKVVDGGARIETINMEDERES